MAAQVSDQSELFDLLFYSEVRVLSLLKQHRLLLLDEPFGTLDAVVQKTLHALDAVFHVISLPLLPVVLKMLFFHLNDLHTGCCSLMSPLVP